MSTLAEIKRQIAACPRPYIFWTQKEIRALPEVLDQGEVIRALTSGYIDGATWLAVCTTRRIIFLNRGMFYGLRQVQFPLDRIQSIDHEFTLLFGSIRVWDGASAFTLNMVSKGSILPFVKVTEDAMYKLRHNVTAKPAAAAPAADVATQLAKLAELKEKGYLTEDEFQSQKKKLLG